MIFKDDIIIPGTDFRTKSFFFGEENYSFFNLLLKDIKQKYKISENEV